MAEGTFTAGQVREMLRRACEEAGSQAAFAAKHDIHHADVNFQVNGRRPPTRRLVGSLGR